MKHRLLISTLGALTLVASSAWVSGNSAHAITFTPPPGGSAPSQATGGASRGVNFLPPPSRGTPTQTTGGAARGNLFIPKSGNGVPQGSVGGASRGNLFTPTSGNGIPQQAAGGASRAGTYSLNPSTMGAGEPAAIMALLPKSYFGTTLAERPAILVYLPASTAKDLVFSLKDEAGSLKYQMTLPVSGAAGVVSIKLPAEASALEVGKTYQWFLALKVDGYLSPNTPYVDGWVQRIQPSAELATALQHPDAIKRATVLGAKGIWYDCVATLATLRTTQPNSDALAKDWTDLLTSVGLQDITKASIGPL